jgi:hypothetical protein
MLLTTAGASEADSAGLAGRLDGPTATPEPERILEGILLLSSYTRITHYTPYFGFSLLVHVALLRSQ